MAVVIALTLIVRIVLGFLATIGIGGFLWKLVEGEQTTQAAEQTEQDAIGSLNEVINNVDLPQDIRDEAARKLIEITGPAVLEPPVVDDGGPGFFQGLTSTANTVTLAVVAFGALALLGKRR